MSYPENGTGPVATYTAEDPDGGDISWSLPNTTFETDLSDFSISGGILSFRSSPDHESPHDSNRDNVYKVTVRASDPNGGTDDRNVTITVTNVNERPVVDSRILNQRLTVDSSEEIGLLDKFSDPDRDTLQYTATSLTTSVATESVTGSTLTITAVGVGTATVTVTAHDRASGGLSVSQSFTVTVPNRNPTIDPGQPSVSYPENGTGPVATYTAEDPDGGDISWSLPNTTFETDLSDFSISGGILSFRSSPDHESPHDSNRDNVYKVTVRASDPNGGTDDRNVTITVTNVNERPLVDTEIDDQTLTVGANRGVGLLDKFRDPDDGDTLRYTANSSAAGVATVSVRGGTLTIRAVGAGTTMVTVTAHDRAVGVSGGLDVDQDFTVTVELPPLVEVANFTAMPGSAHGEIALDWDPVDGADSYEVGQWQLQPGNLYDYEVLDDSEVTIDLQATSAVVRGLTPSFTYTHSVRAVRGVGSDKVVGDWAVGQDAAAHDESPETPTVFVVAQTIGGRGISLSWKAAMGAADYEAEASSTGGTSLDIAPGLTTGFTGLVPGDSYSFRVRSRKPHDGGHLFSDWTAALTVSGPTPTHWWGHQADHTVGYVLALATTTDPLLQAAIPVAVAEWNGRMNFGLMICDTADSACRVRNSDRFIATIKTVAPSSPSDNVTGCGSSMACVSPTSGGVGAPGGVGDHMTNMDVIFEDPPYTCANDMDPCQVGDQVTYTWTDVSRLSHEEVTAGDPTHLYLHAKHLALHELGHTLGLPDFYFVPAPHPAANYDPRLASETAIMNLQWEAKSIQDTDIAQLDAIYLLHSSHSAR